MRPLGTSACAFVSARTQLCTARFHLAYRRRALLVLLALVLAYSPSQCAFRAWQNLPSGYPTKGIRILVGKNPHSLKRLGKTIFFSLKSTKHKVFGLFDSWTAAPHKLLRPYNVRKISKQIVNFLKNFDASVLRETPNLKHFSLILTYTF